MQEAPCGRSITCFWPNSADQLKNSCPPEIIKFFLKSAAVAVSGQLSASHHRQQQQEDAAGAARRSLLQFEIYMQ
jgi:hypothetical protein